MRPPASRRMVSADRAARSARLSTIRYSSVAVDLAAAHAHRVDHRHSAGRDIVAVADPAGRLPGDRLAEVGAGLLDQLEQRSASGVSGLGGRPKPPCELDLDLALGGDRRHRVVDRALRRALSSSGVRGPQIDPQDREVGDDIARAAALDPRRIDR